MPNTLIFVLTTAACWFVAPSEAVAVNPLPAPQSITWGTSGPKQVSGGLVYKAQQDNIAYPAWERAFDAITTLKWIPAATEAPISSFAPFPTATAAAKRGSSLLTEVNVEIDEDRKSTRLNSSHI